MRAAGAEEKRKEPSGTAWAAICHPVKIGQTELACIYLLLDLDQLLVTNFSPQCSLSDDRKTSIALAGLGSRKNDHARSLGLDECTVSLGAIQRYIDDQPGRITARKEGFDTL